MPCSIYLQISPGKLRILVFKVIKWLKILLGSLSPFKESPVLLRNCCCADNAVNFKVSIYDSLFPLVRNKKTYLFKIVTDLL